MHRVVRNTPPKSLILKNKEWIAFLNENKDIHEDCYSLNRSIKNEIKEVILCCH